MDITASIFFGCYIMSDLCIGKDRRGICASYPLRFLFTYVQCVESLFKCIFDRERKREISKLFRDIRFKKKEESLCNNIRVNSV